MRALRTICCLGFAAVLIVLLVWLSVRGGELAPGDDAAVDAAPRSGAVLQAEPRPTAVDPRAAARIPAAASSRWQVTGTVRDEATGAALPDAVVVARRLDSRTWQAAAARRELAQTTTDQVGRYRLDLRALEGTPDALLAWWWVEVQATAPGYQPSFWEQGEPRVCRDDGLVQDWALARFAGVFGHVVDRGGAPVRDAWVACWDPREEMGSTTETDHEGRFWLDWEASVELLLAAGRQGHGLSATERVRVAGGALGPRELVLDQSLGVVAGEVRFADGSPAAGVGLEAELLREAANEPSPSEEWQPWWSEAGASFGSPEPTVSDPRGRFAFHLLRPGARYRIGFAEGENQIVAAEPFAPVEARVGQRGLLLVARAARLDYAARTEHGDALPDVRVHTSVWGPDDAAAAGAALARGGPVGIELEGASLGGATAMSLATVRQVWAPWGGLVVVEGDAPGFAPVRTTTPVAVGAGRIPVELRMHPLAAPAFVALAVEDPAGEPVRAFQWRAHTVGALGDRWLAPEVGAAPGNWTTAPADGRIGPLPPGRVVLEVLAGIAPGVRPARHLVEQRLLELEPGAERPLGVRLRDSAQLKLELRATSLRSEAEDAVVFCELTRGDGTRVAPSPQLVQVLASGAAERIGLLRLRRDEPAVCVVGRALEPGPYVLELRVRSADGQVEYLPVRLPVSLRAGHQRLPVTLTPRF